MPPSKTAVTPRLLLPLLLLTAAAPPRPRIVAASGQWAALQQGLTCEAATAALRPALKDRPQARASIAFDAASGRRHGEFAARLSKTPRDGASVVLHIDDQAFLLVARGDMAWSRGPVQETAIIAALRMGGGMRVEARSPGGGRIVDRFVVAGAATAIDAAAACAATFVRR